MQAAARRNHRARRRQPAVIGFETANLVFTTGIDIENPDTGYRSSRDPDIAIGDAPQAFDRFRVSCRRMKPSRYGGLLAARLKREHRHTGGGIAERGIQEMSHRSPPIDAPGAALCRSPARFPATGVAMPLSDDALRVGPPGERCENECPELSCGAFANKGLGLTVRYGQTFGFLGAGARGTGSGAHRAGDRWPASVLPPGYDPDWRHNVQVYPAALKLGDLWDLTKYFSDHSRMVGHHDTAAAFGLMTGLANDRLVNEDISFCDPIEQPVGRAFQAAIKVLDAFYSDERLRVDPAYLAAARIVVLCVQAELFLHDLVQKKRELSAWALGKARHPSPGAFNTVPDVLALWRGLRIGGEAFEGSRLDAVAHRFGLDRSTISESVNNVAIPTYRRNSAVTAKGWRYPNGRGIGVGIIGLKMMG
jgi:hypothetical protein